MDRVRRFVAIVATAALAAGIITAGAPSAVASPTPVTAYNAVPAVLPGNVVSLAFQATQASEFGDLVALSAPGVASDVTVVLSSWGCQAGAWTSSDCVTAAGATFNHPLTLNLYEVGAGSTVGPLILSKTVSFDIPYRPSADNVNCTGANAGKWYSASENHCYNGFATKVTFDVSSLNASLPSQVIWTVAFNTSGFGASPLGYATACASTPQGCPYDSLNVGAESLPGQPSVGSDVDPAGAFYSSVTPGQYCDGGVGGAGRLRNDTGCWTGYRPLATIRTAGSYTFTGFGPPVNNGHVVTILVVFRESIEELYPKSHRFSAIGQRAACRAV